MQKRNWEELLKSYQDSGLKQVDFCREQNIPYSTFAIQLRKWKADSGPKFVRVETASVVELELLGGVKLKVRENQLAVVLQALSAPCAR